MIAVGAKAPDFTLPDKDGRLWSLSDFAGQKVVLYFYPRDNTPGCTRQACAFGASYNAFREKNIQVIGISRDSVASHQRFAEKFGLPFILPSPLSFFQIPSFQPFVRTAYGEKRRWQARYQWESSAQPLSSTRQVISSILWKR